MATWVVLQSDETTLTIGPNSGRKGDELQPDERPERVELVALDGTKIATYVRQDTAPDVPGERE
jgi:hypothetical protein